jgi:hypothetical protein
MMNEPSSIQAGFPVPASAAAAHPTIVQDPPLQASAPRLTLFLFSRLSFSLVVLISSLYGLLCYIPFTYYWMIKDNLLPWLTSFVKYQPYFFAATLLLTILTLPRAYRSPRLRRLAIGVSVCNVTIAGWLFYSRLLLTYGNDDSSLRWALISLCPLLWLSAVDFAEHLPTQRWRDTEKFSLPSWVSSALAALFLALLYAGISYFRFRGDEGFQFSRREFALMVLWGFVSYLVMFLVGCIVLHSLERLSQNRRSPSLFRFFLRLGLGALVGAGVIIKTVMAAISFGGVAAYLYTAGATLAVTLLIGGIRLYTGHWFSVRATMVRDENAAAHGRTNRLTRPFRFLAIALRHDLYRSRTVACLAMIAVIAYLGLAVVGRMDWDFLLQKLSVMAVWLMTLLVIGRVGRAARVYSLVGLGILTVACLGIFGLAAFAQKRLPSSATYSSFNGALANYKTHDVSLRLAQDIFSSMSPTVTSPSQTELYDFLIKHTSLLPSVNITPPDIRLTENLKPATGPKPNIFIFMIDSLRQDYLSPYNDQVTFTPELQKFAGESVVMKNSFTAYGGTVLSEPTLWSGTLQLHKQYVTPYYPMNSLQKLIEVDDYQKYISMDPVVDIIVNKTPDIVPLDEGLTDQTWQTQELGKTLEELKGKLDARTDRSKPIFFFSQPQNLHIRNLEWRRTRHYPTDNFPNFDPYYASQVHQMDQAIGDFIEYLKRTGQYENSIVMITSDHGDALGEMGRWGHGTWIYPEVIRVPIIMHVPPAMLKGMYWNTENAAFNTDITPSLYYLLGHRPLTQNPIFGKPWFTETRAEQADYQNRSYLVASSYGPTYGIVNGDGSTLFIADAQNKEDYYFDLKKDRLGAPNLVTPDIRSRNDRLIRERVDAIARFFNFNP